jgi:GT2 family glycosyltransferase
MHQTVQVDRSDTGVISLPQLSICIPAYNRPDGLRTAVTSILSALTPAQTAAIELVITDDSTLATPQVECLLHGWQGAWQYHKNPQRLGMVANWNQSLAYARGEFVLLLHDDDYLLPQGIPHLLHTLNCYGSRYDVFLFGVHLVDGQGHCLRKQIPPRARWLPPATAVRQLLSHSSFVRFPALVWRRSLLARVGEFSHTYGEATDIYQWLRFFATAGVYTVPLATAAYTIHDQALSMGMFQPQTLGHLSAIFQEARQLNLLPPRVLHHAQRDFLHQFILAGTWRFLRRRQWQQAAAVYRLLEAPEVTGRSPRWAVTRFLFGVALRLLRVDQA